MIARTYSCHIDGMEAEKIMLEANIIRGFPSFSIVGLAGTAIQESRERIRSSIISMGYRMPLGKILINLYPADLRKKGSHWDFPIAMALLASMDLIDPLAIREMAFIGELSLDGRLRPVPGAYSMVYALRSAGIKKIFLPAGNLSYCKTIKEVELYPSASLSQVLAHMKGIEEIKSFSGRESISESRSEKLLDYADIRGRNSLKRLVQLAVAGRHSILLSGRPGLGKSMLLNRIPSILPQLDDKEMEEVYRIHSLLEAEGRISSYPPFRSPHQSISLAGLIGGGNPPLPGEISLAHKGVLFLDELPHFSKLCLENLRTPMEKQELTISRSNRRLYLPADFQFVAAMNPCPCGYYGARDHDCTCKNYEINRYLNKISAPLLDRIDIVREVGDRNEDDKSRKSSKDMLEPIMEARERQKYRYRGENFSYNSRISDSYSMDKLKLKAEADSCVNFVKNKGLLSDRQTKKLICLARSVADLENKEEVSEDHIMEAFQYRRLPEYLDRES